MGRYEEKTRTYGHGADSDRGRGGGTPGRRTRVEQEYGRHARRVSFNGEGETIEAKYLPPEEVDSGQVPGDAVAVHVNTSRLEANVWDALAHFDLDSNTGLTVKAALHDITLPDYWKDHLANRKVFLPLRWETDDYTATGSLEARFTVVQADFEMADQVPVGDQSTSTTGVGQQSGGSTTETITVGGKAGGGGAEGSAGYQEANARSYGDGANVGGSVTRVTSPTGGVRFKLHLQWDGLVQVTITPKPPLGGWIPTPVPPSILRRTVNIPFIFRDTAVVRFPISRCRPVAKAVGS